MARHDLARIEQRKRVQFLDRVARVHDVSSADAAAWFEADRLSSVRVNRLATSDVDAVASELRAGWPLEPIGWCPDAFFLLDDKRGLAASPLFRQGRVYLQNASSLVPPLTLDPRPGDRVLDAAAAPGGKASHVAALVDNDLHLWVNDAIKPRVAKLRAMLQLLHVRVEQVTDHLAQHLDKHVDARFDRVLLDAQCTGEGRVDLRDPKGLEHWSQRRIDEYGWLQRRMLVAAFKLLRPGGTLVYSTCTIAPEENEAPVDHLLRHHPAQLAPIDLDFDERVPARPEWRGRPFSPSIPERALRVRPSARMEAFFVACIRRRDDG